MNNTVFCIKYTNALRGIAILLVILQHVWGGVFHYRIFTPCGGIGVALFLILSGYGLNESYKNKGVTGFWKSKLFRVYIPYIIWLSFLILYSHGAFISTSYFYDVFLLDTSYWYVGYLFWWYIIFWISSVLCKKGRLKVIFLLSVLLFLLDEKCIRAEQSFSFLAGVILSEHKSWLDKINRDMILRIAFPCFTVGITALAIKQMPFIRGLDGTYVFYLVQCLIKLPFAIALLFIALLFRNVILNNMALSLFGIMSLELYLVHMRLLSLIRSYMDIVPFVVISMGLAYSFYKFNNYVSSWFVSKKL